MLNAADNADMPQQLLQLVLGLLMNKKNNGFILLLKEFSLMKEYFSVS
jgi:hypothetical protein